jgi:hypothetical protein
MVDINIDSAIFVGFLVATLMFGLYSSRGIKTSNSPYAKALFCRKIANSFLDAIFAATNNLYLMAK